MMSIANTLCPENRYERRNDVLMSSLLGEICNIYGGFDREKGVEVAWHEFSTISMDKNDVNDILREINSLIPLDHPCLLNVINGWYCETKQVIIAITEIVCAGKNVRSFLEKAIASSKHLTPERVLIRWTKQLCQALQYLHSQNPIPLHTNGTLQASNIYIVGNRGDVRLGVFGMIKSSKLRIKHSKSTYFAPELHHSVSEPNPMSDIYALGTCILELAIRECINSDLISVASNVKDSKELIKIRPEAWERIVPSPMKLFISRCWSGLSDRPTVSELIHDPWIANATPVFNFTNGDLSSPYKISDLVPKALRRSRSCPRGISIILPNQKAESLSPLTTNIGSEAIQNYNSRPATQKNVGFATNLRSKATSFFPEASDSYDKSSSVSLYTMNNGMIGTVKEEYEGDSKACTPTKNLNSSATNWSTSNSSISSTISIRSQMTESRKQRSDSSLKYISSRTSSTSSSCSSSLSYEGKVSPIAFDNESEILSLKPIDQACIPNHLLLLSIILRIKKDIFQFQFEFDVNIDNPMSVAQEMTAPDVSQIFNVRQGAVLNKPQIQLLAKRIQEMALERRQEIAATQPTRNKLSRSNANESSFSFRKAALRIHEEAQNDTNPVNVA